MVRLLHCDDALLIDHAAADVFDNPADPVQTRAFLADPRHHIVAAIDNGIMVGFVSAVDYIHPDKPAELWINETGVAATHQRQGLASAMMAAMLDHGRAIACTTAWVLTDRTNAAANALYLAAGGTEGVDGDPDNRAMTGYSFDLGHRVD